MRCCSSALLGPLELVIEDPEGDVFMPAAGNGDLGALSALPFPSHPDKSVDPY